MTGRLWGGRFTGDADPLMQAYNDSLPFDKIFWRQDIAGSIAYARANSRCGVITKEEFEQIQKGFGQVGKEWETYSFEIKPNDEDIHTANERRLGEIIGKEIAGKLHTGRRFAVSLDFDRILERQNPDSSMKTVEMIK